MGPERFITLCIAVPPAPFQLNCLRRCQSRRRLGGSAAATTNAVCRGRGRGSNPAQSQVAYTFAQRHVICERAPLGPLLEHHNSSFRGIREHRGGRLLGHTTLAIQPSLAGKQATNTHFYTTPKNRHNCNGTPTLLALFCRKPRDFRSARADYALHHARHCLQPAGRGGGRRRQQKPTPSTFSGQWHSVKPAGRRHNAEERALW